ncbi:MAG: endospore germination permease [Clostridiaceae bacterium]|nr:endospore germination permease [Eubacteriales bacterium]
MDKLKSLYAKCIIIMFVIGSTVVVGVSTAARRDAWMSILVATAYAIPVVLMYARIMKLFPEMGFYDIMESVAGKVGGKILIALFTWYAFHLGSLVLRNFIEFIQMNVLRETPRIAVMILFMSAISYLVKSGLLTMGKLAVLSLGVFLFVMVVTVVGSVNQMDLRYILPVLSTDWSIMLEDGFNIFSFPFAETVLFLVAASAVRKQDSPYRIYMWSLLFSAAVLIIIVIRNILILGPAMTVASYFPSYVAARIINIGDFFARIEGSISINFILSGIIKISVCLFAAAEGTAKLAGLNSHKRLVLPISLMMMALCEIVYSNLMEMFAWLKPYSFYAIPFQIIFPALIWVLAEIKAHKAAKLGAGRAGA